MHLVVVQVDYLAVLLFVYSVHVSPFVCTSAPVGSPSVWAYAPTASGALSLSRSMSRAVNVALSSSDKKLQK